MMTMDQLVYQFQQRDRTLLLHFPLPVFTQPVTPLSLTGMMDDDDGEGHACGDEW